MPRKIRQLIADLERTGFINRDKKEAIGISKMNESIKYIKIVEWSDEDECFIGYCPGIIGPCCHGTDEVEVYQQLCEIVDEWIKIFHRDNDPLPPPTIGKNIEEFLNGTGNN